MPDKGVPMAMFCVLASTIPAPATNALNVDCAGSATGLAGVMGLLDAGEGEQGDHVLADEHGVVLCIGAEC